MKPLLLTAQIGFVGLTLIYFTLLLRELKQGVSITNWPESRKKKFFNRILISLAVWIVFVSAWSLSGIMGNFSIVPINMMPVLFIPLVTIIVIFVKGTFNEVLKNIPLENIIRLQSFRFFVEIFLWLLFLDNLLPVQMTFEGRNFDILAGITAPLVAWVVARNKISTTGLMVWNILCLGLLINIVSIAILSMPGPFRVFTNEPSNTIVAQFPISWLPGFLVPLAYTLHLFSLKQLILIKAQKSLPV